MNKGIYIYTYKTYEHHMNQIDIIIYTVPEKTLRWNPKIDRL